MGNIVQPDGLEIYTQYESGEISDGYHTFDELYEYRMLYNAGLFNMLQKWDKAHGSTFKAHKSIRHFDGELCFGGGWFIVIAYLPTGQISNHYEMSDWDLFNIPERKKADEWDGHTPEQVADRLHSWLESKD